MERLTEHHVNKTLGAYMVCSGACIDDNFDCNGCKKLEKMVDRLSAYEDTGLGPEEITTEPYGCVFYFNRKCNLDGDFCAEGPGCPYEIGAEAAKHLLELAKAEKDGRLVMLPCKVGDTVYIIRSEKVIIATVETIHQWSSGKWKLNVHTDKRYTHWVGYEVFFDDFGKTVFLTREEAEAALKKREADNEDESIRSLGRQEPGT